MNINNNTTARTVSVRYSMAFVFIIALLFFFSQVLDNIFYDYTVVETEIVFVKRVNRDSDVEIELNEITESTNSLIQAFKSNSKQLIKAMGIEEKQPEMNEMLLQRGQNSAFKQSISRTSHTELLNNFDSADDTIYVASISNRIAPGTIQKPNHSLMTSYRLYFDSGHNFFDLSGAITLSTQWFNLCERYYQGSFITAFAMHKDTIALHLTNTTDQILELFNINEPRVSQQINLDGTISQITMSNNTVVYTYALDTYVFHSLIRFSKLIQQTQNRMNDKWIHSSQAPLILSNEDIYTRTVAILFLESLNEQPLLMVSEVQITLNGIFLQGDIYSFQDEWKILYPVFKINITSYISFKEIYDFQKININYIHEYDPQTRIYVTCFLNQFLVHFQLHQFMFHRRPLIIPQYQIIKFGGVEMEELTFHNIHYSNTENSVYILTESKSQRFKIYSVDLEQLNEVYKIRMPFFSHEKMIKDFQIKTNHYNQIVLVVVFADGDVAGILKLQYGEGVLNKSFLIELLDVILTLSFIGFFKFLKKLFTRVSTKLIQMCKRRRLF